MSSTINLKVALGKYSYPIFIGQEKEIQEEADNIGWNIDAYKLININ